MTSDRVEFCLFGGEGAEKRGGFERVYSETEKMFCYLKELFVFLNFFFFFFFFAPHI